ncbi:MAG: hypothetical protein ABL983_03230 [Nitrospira sp.]|nr:MAG: hypothetical protein E8D44_12750 [Nitrospira sp.]
MPTQDILHNKSTPTALIALVVTQLLSGCASTDIFHGHNHSLRPRTAVSSAQNWLSVAVWLEDQCESQGADQQRATMLEALHDGLVVPTETLLAVAIVTVAGSAWSLYDRLALPSEEPLPNRPQTVMEYVKPHRAVPQHPSHSKSHAPDIPITWLGCLSAYGDG